MKIVGAWFLLVLIFQTNVSFGNEDPCDSLAIDDSRAPLTLKSAHKSRDGFVGIFELENRNLTSILVIPGIREKGVFFLRKPQFWIEYKDLSGHWQPLPDLPRDNINTEYLKLSVGSKTEFSAYLMPQELANLQVSDFRALIRIFDQTSFCIRSKSFRSVPTRKKAEGFKVIP